MSIVLDEQYYELLHELQAVDFVLVELNLFLDTHPMDAAALQQYNHFVPIRHQIAQKYESLYGPLQAFGRSYSGTPWQWIESPWPWQV